MAPTRMQFDVSFGPGGRRPRDDDAPMHLLVLADLGGSRRAPLAQRQALSVDIDNLDARLGQIAPSLTLELDGQALALAFSSLDDFHPDQLWTRLPAFDALRRLRSELDDPAGFARAAAALGLSAAPPSPAAATPEATAASDDVARLLGRRPAAMDAPAPVPADALQKWLHDLVAPHVVPDVAHEQRALRRAADAALGDLMRRLLHHPRLQALEAAWRGVDRLVRGLELGESLHLSVLDIGRDEIDADLAAHRADLTASALHRHLSGGRDGAPWGLFVLDQAFGPGAADVQVLASLGAMAARAGAPLLASATPQAAGAADTAQLAEPRGWLADDAPALAAWAALRTSPMAAWIGLSIPRVLLRLPYGAATDRIAGFDFEEMPAPREHGAYLWGHGAMALALLAGRAFLEDGWSMDLDRQLVLDDLPSHTVVDDDGEKRQQPGTEVLLSEIAAQAVAGRGLMPLVAWRDRPAARLWGWQSLADPPRALQGLGA
ncbi:type VI secretion system contractile sheath domain-containing protein [Ideonella sp. A 288]|uniref:type VI secretion system contractile sheath domain-containing protein n=1 Tax=Ideonella sp. A 288 TaxID=1962181 RepID=UPI000B4BB484|nr:type VI secretion system contractile sheath large subunit [Ideonella sp. A 288]